MAEAHLMYLNVALAVELFEVWEDLSLGALELEAERFCTLSCSCRLVSINVM